MGEKIYESEKTYFNNFITIHDVICLYRLCQCLRKSDKRYC